MIQKLANKRERDKTVVHELEVGFYEENKARFFTAMFLQWKFRAAPTRYCNCMGLLCTVYFWSVG